MSNRNYWIASVLALGLCRPLPAFVPNEEQGQAPREPAAGFLVSSEPLTEWAFVQGAPANDGPRRGSGGFRGRQASPGEPGRFDGPRGGPRGTMGKGGKPFPPRILNQLRNMRPDERERVLQNNPRFRELPAERKAELLNRLNMLLEMNDNQRRELDRRLSAFRNLSPQQRRRAREIYENHWRTLSPDRRTAILEEFRHLRDLPSEERDRRTASDEYQMQFSSEERALLDELSSL